MTLKPGGEHPATHHLPPGWLRRILEHNHHEGRIMTTWSLTLRVDRLDEGESTPVTEVAIASMSSPDPRTVAAVLRATADQLDPPKPPRPAYRRGDHMREALAGYGGTRCPDCIGDRHTYEPGRCALKPPWNGVTVVVDDPGDRMDAPDAVLSTAAARRNLVTPDGCGREHTYREGCAFDGKAP